MISLLDLFDAAPAKPGDSDLYCSEASRVPDFILPFGCKSRSDRTFRGRAV